MPFFDFKKMKLVIKADIKSNRCVIVMFTYRLKLAVIGDTGVGKSSLVKHLVEDLPAGNHIPTIGADFSSCILNIDNDTVKLQIWDTGGSYEFRELLSSFVNKCCGIVVCYDITDKRTFLQLRHNWIPYIRETIGSKPTIMITGLKKDDINQRRVTIEEGESLAQEFNCLFMELGLKRKSNSSNRCFTELVSKIIEDINLHIVVPIDENGIVVGPLSTRHLEYQHSFGCDAPPPAPKPCGCCMIS